MIDSFCCFLLVRKGIKLTFVATFKIPENMFEFSQYLGFLAFLTILTIGFWLMMFLITFVVPYWIYGGVKELLQERKAKRDTEQIA